MLPRTSLRCPQCALPLPESRACAGCLQDPPACDEVLTAFDYRFPVDGLVRRFKFSTDLAAGAYLGDALGEAVGSAAMPSLVLASPASAARLRERGFHAARLLARRVAARRGIEHAGRVLLKIRDTPPQSGLGRRARQRNVKDAFVVHRPLDGLHVAVVDDVMTTGATMNAMARALKEAGAARVSGWVAARTPEPLRAD